MSWVKSIASGLGEEAWILETATLTPTHTQARVSETATLAHTHTQALVSETATLTHTHPGAGVRSFLS